MPTLLNIRNKVRRVTGKLSANEITDPQIDEYINNYYQYDFPEELRLQNLRVNYQFTTNANQPVCDFPTEFYLTNMPPVFVAGYQSFMTQSRQNFFRISPQLMFLQQATAMGNGTQGPYNIQLINTPIVKGWKPNPPGAYSDSVVATASDVRPSDINWNVLISGVDQFGKSICLIDDGGGNAGTQIGNLFSPDDPSSDPGFSRGSINYSTGQVYINDPVTHAAGPGFSTPIANGAPINVQYIPYVASRPQSVCFFQDQFILWPIPDQAYTVSFEAYKQPTAMLTDGDSPQLNEWWQTLAYGAADRIFADNGDLENLQKFRPLLDEQLKLIQRRTIVQQTAERTSTIYTEQSTFPQYPFGNFFGGI